MALQRYFPPGYIPPVDAVLSTNVDIDFSNMQVGDMFIDTYSAEIVRYDGPGQWTQIQPPQPEERYSNGLKSYTSGGGGGGTAGSSDIAKALQALDVADLNDVDNNSVLLTIEGTSNDTIVLNYVDGAGAKKKLILGKVADA